MNIIYTASIVSIVFLASGCQTIYNTADSVGQHMPVIGQRCENWQCFTQSGQQASAEKISQQQVQAQSQNQTNTAPADQSAAGMVPVQNTGQNPALNPQYPSQIMPPPQRQTPPENPAGGN